ncbi:MAG: hypothetical protein WCG14_01510 [Chlamydiia bacterium]
MTIGQVSTFLCQSPLRSGRLTIQGALSEQEEKTVRTAVLRFNLTPRPSNLICSYQITQMPTSIVANLQQGDRPTWIALATVVCVLGMTILGGYYFTSFYNHCYEEAFMKVASGVWGIYDHDTQLFLRPATVDDFMLAPKALRILSCIAAISMNGLAWTGFIDTPRPIPATQITLNPLIRDEPNQIGNNRDDDGAGWEEPITFDNIPEENLCSPYYAYVDNYAVSIPSLLRTMFHQGIGRHSHHQQDYLVCKHPITGAWMNRYQSGEAFFHIIRVLGLTTRREFLSILQPGGKNRLLRLFNQDVYPLLNLTPDTARA